MRQQAKQKTRSQVVAIDDDSDVQAVDLHQTSSVGTMSTMFAPKRDAALIGEWLKKSATRPTGSPASRLSRHFPSPVTVPTPESPCGTQRSTKQNEAFGAMRSNPRFVALAARVAEKSRMLDQSQPGVEQPLSGLDGSSQRVDQPLSTMDQAYFNVIQPSPTLPQTEQALEAQANERRLHRVEPPPKYCGEKWFR